jgi:tRNA (guanine37-N1)-methyltransferase
MRFDVVTLFPELFEAHLTHGVTRRAFESARVDVKLWQLREFGDEPHRRVDDRPYGGGPGMVLLVEPLLRAIAAIRGARPDGREVRLVHFTPTGRRLDQAAVQAFAEGPGAILLCGRYEGIDQRFIDRHVDVELSLGDFVLSGGELAALVLLDAVARLQPGVLGDQASHQQDSFSDGLLDCPHYSRPVTLRSADDAVDTEATPTAADAAASVPAVLLSGNHAQIARWRRERSLELTWRRRPDLIAAAEASGTLSLADRRFLASLRL